jgi:hypothetical protein
MNTRERFAGLLLGGLGAALTIHCGSTKPEVSAPGAVAIGAPSAEAGVTPGSGEGIAADEQARENLALARGHVDAAVKALLLVDASDKDALSVAAASVAAAASAAGAAEVATPSPTPPSTPEQQAAVEFENGGRLRYGLSVSLLHYSVSRSSAEPGRMRNYLPKLDFIPPEVGFQFTFQPATGPWRLRKKSDSTNGKTSTFQLMSWGGMLLVRVDNKDLAQGAIRLGGTINFFENVVGIGLGFDLYRGIPVLGANGVNGGSTAYTGLLSWAFSKQGELTPENIFFVMTFGLDPIVKALSGELGSSQ